MDYSSFSKWFEVMFIYSIKRCPDFYLLDLIISFEKGILLWINLNKFQMSIH